LTAGLIDALRRETCIALGVPKIGAPAPALSNDANFQQDDRRFSA
jgi:hypothetical protein